MLIWLNSHCLSATGHTSSALFNRRVNFDVTLHWDLTLWPLCAMSEWAAGLIQTKPIIFCIEWRMLHHGQGWDVYVYMCSVDVFLCMWASACCFRGCVDRTWRMCPVCGVFPAFVCTSPPPQRCTSFPPALLGKISSNLTSMLVVSLRGCEVTELMALLCEVFLTLLID